jgi:hypothetical protein
MSKIVSGSFIIETLRFQCQTHSLNVLTKVIRAMEVMPLTVVVMPLTVVARQL